MSDPSLADVIHPIEWVTSAASAVPPRQRQISLWFLDQAQIPQHTEWLTPGELVRTETMTAGRRDEFVSGRNALRSILGCFLDIAPREVTIRLSERGKPCLDDDVIEFSFSHCRGKLLMAFAAEPLGADLERVLSKPNLQRIASRLFDRRCCERIEAAGSEEERRDLFYQFWSAHEAVQKIRGDGIFGQRHLPSFVAGFMLHGFRGAVATSIEAPEILMHEELPSP